MVSELTVDEQATDELLVRRYDKDATLLKALFTGVVGYMTYVTIRASLKRNLFKDLPRLSKEPWFTATIKDYYLNILLFSTWMAYKEKSNSARAGWLAAFCGLGSIATGAYALKALLDLPPGAPLEKMLLRSREGGF